MMRKHRSLTLVGVLVLSASLLTLTSRTGLAQEPPTPIPPTSDIAQDGLIFEEPRFGLRISYPPTYYVAKWEPDPDRLLYVSFIDRKYQDTMPAQDIGLVVYPNSQGQSLQDWFTGHSGSFTAEGLAQGIIFVDPVEVQTVAFEDRDALTFTTGGMGTMYNTLVAQGTYMIKLYRGIGPDDDRATYELMLSTLEIAPSH